VADWIEKVTDEEYLSGAQEGRNYLIFSYIPVFLISLEILNSISV